MGKKRITIYDLAEKLGISATTVSRALKGHQGIAKDTVLSVRKMAEEMGYRPNILASSLRTNKSFSIAVLVPQINRNFMSTLISGIDDIASARGYNVLIAQSMDDPEKEFKTTQSLLCSSVDGVIASLAMRNVSIDHFKMLLDHNIPVVLVDRVAQELEVDKVIVDNFKAGYQATEYLIDMGHRRIAHLSGASDRNVYTARKAGYIAALQKHNLCVDETLILASDLSEEAGIACVNKLMQREVLPDGIFAANDTAAVSALQQLKRLNFRVPGDISVVGFNNDPISSIIEPRLTTIEHPAYEIGQTAATKLLNRIELENLDSQPVETTILKTNLLIGASTIDRRKMHSNPRS